MQELFFQWFATNPLVANVDDNMIHGEKIDFIDMNLLHVSHRKLFFLSKIVAEYAVRSDPSVRLDVSKFQVLVFLALNMSHDFNVGVQVNLKFPAVWFTLACTLLTWTCNEASSRCYYGHTVCLWRDDECEEQLLELELKIYDFVKDWRGGLVANTFLMLSCPPYILIRLILRQWFFGWIPLTDILKISLEVLRAGSSWMDIVVHAVAGILIQLSNVAQGKLLISLGFGVGAIERLLAFGNEMRYDDTMFGMST